MLEREELAPEGQVLQNMRDPALLLGLVDAPRVHCEREAAALCRVFVLANRNFVLPEFTHNGFSHLSHLLGGIRAFHVIT